MSAIGLKVMTGFAVLKNHLASDLDQSIKYMHVAWRILKIWQVSKKTSGRKRKSPRVQCFLRQLFKKILKDKLMAICLHVIRQFASKITVMFDVKQKKVYLRSHYMQKLKLNALYIIFSFHAIRKHDWVIMNLIYH